MVPITPDPEFPLGVFEFVLVLVVVTTIGKVVTAFADRRALPPPGPSASPPEVEALRDAVADLGTRLHRLEEERDFYKDLLEAPREPRSLPSGDSAKSGSEDAPG